MEAHDFSRADNAFSRADNATKRSSPRMGATAPCTGADHPHANGEGDCQLPQALFDFRYPVGTLEDLAGLGTIGGADDAVALH